MENNSKLKSFKTLRIIGLSMISLGVILLIIGLVLDNNIGLIFGGSSCASTGIFLTIISFLPSIVKIMGKTSVKVTKEILNENKDDLKDIADTNVEIMEDAITKTSKAIKKGFKDTKYCKHCGEEIAEDATFCSKCGKEQ